MSLKRGIMGFSKKVRRQGIVLDIQDRLWWIGVSGIGVPEGARGIWWKVNWLVAELELWDNRSGRESVDDVFAREPLNWDFGWFSWEEPLLETPWLDEWFRNGGYDVECCEFVESLTELLPNSGMVNWDMTTPPICESLSSFAPFISKGTRLPPNSAMEGVGGNLLATDGSAYECRICRKRGFWLP